MKKYLYYRIFILGILAWVVGTTSWADDKANRPHQTLVGTGQAGYTGDGGPATKALLNQPFHCEVDGRGNLYVAEAFNHCVRKVNLQTGVITTVAGNGKKGYTGDGGPATQATFNEPYAVVVDGQNNLFIADRLNVVVRKVDGQTGIVTTIAGTGKKGYGGDGGPGAKALMIEPNDCFLDGKGGLLIADVGDWRIRRLDLASGVITTFADTGRPKVKGKPARSSIGDGGPANKAIVVGARAVCVDGQGNTFICEREGSSIRKVNARGIITTIGGTGQWGDSGDGGDAKTATFKGPKGIRCDKDGHIFIVDTENHSVRRIDAKTNVVTTVAGGRKGKDNVGMDRPHGCVVDTQGTLYIADSNNHRVCVRKVR